MLFTGELVADCDLWIGLPLGWLHGRSEAAFAVLSLHHADELPGGCSHHNTLHSLLTHICSDVPKRTVRTDGRRTCLHSQFRTGFGSRVQGFSAQQPEHNTRAVHDHTPVPTGCPDTWCDLTTTVIGLTHGDVAPDEFPNVRRVGSLPLPWQTVAEPIQLASNIIKDLREAQAFEPRRGPGAEVSLQVITVDKDGLVLLERCSCLAIELMQGDIDCPG
jgi:hypothetical protein